LSAEEWRAWRDAEIARILKPVEFQGESVLVREVVALRCAAALAQIEPALERGEVPDDLGNFIAFVRAQSWQVAPGHALGLEVSDAEYWRAARDYVSLPPLLASQAFLSKLQYPATYGKAVEMVRTREPGWSVLPFEARFIKSVDRTTYGRLLVVAPDQPGPGGALCDKWVTFAIATVDAAAHPVSVSVVAVVKGGKENTAYFMDYLRQAGPNEIELMPTAVLPTSPSKNCYDCHKSPVVPISPEAVYGSDFAKTDEPLHRELNVRIRGYGKVSHALHEPTAYGPCIGPADSPHRQRVVEECVKAEGLARTSIARVKAAMRCAGCHEAFAPLNYPEPVRTDREVRSMKRTRGIAQTFVEDGLMPPGNDLTASERRALWRALSLEYYDSTSGSGTLVDWLRGRP
jgi:hypothetical protein